MKLTEFSKKQKKVLSWWMKNSPVKDYHGIIGDGSIRSGKTISFSMSFIIWAMNSFDEFNFGFCGKTINSFRRNVWSWLKPLMILRGYHISEKRDESKITITYCGKTNYFYIFGGQDERSQDLVQGITLAGVLFDEVALMPESFVNQATGRCSVTGSKFWFNCNPDNPNHWFKEKWIDQAKEKKLLHLHFTMDDNLSLSEAIKERYRGLYVGVFFKRFILGLWVVAEGAIYDMFSSDENTYEKLPYSLDQYDDQVIAIDYGTTNAFAALKCIDNDEELFIEDEYYFDSRREGFQKTDEQYLDDLDKFTNYEYPTLIVDPSAASFIVAARGRGYMVRQADNTVLDGIRMTSTVLARRMLKINKKCVNLIREIQGYVWDESGKMDKEKPLKIADHAVDAMRYFIKTKILPRRLLSE